jgi:hypothetical protein
MRRILLALAFGLVAVCGAVAQAPAAAQKKIDNDFVQQQFGMEFTLLPEVGAAFGDLDGDGIEDIAIAARCKNPMVDQAEHNYTVIDPYNAFFGYGNPAITTTFSAGDPADRGLVVLIIHGTGPDGWRAAKPKAKFVVINLPFKAISVRKLQLNKKKTVEAIYVQETGELGESSAVFFDGKKFRYVPMGGEMD